MLAMGDFNDEPFDDSLVRHALSTRQRTKVTSARANPLLWNLMWPVAGEPDGSFWFDNQPNMLDQFLVNTNMAVDDAAIRVQPDHGQDPQAPGHGQHRRLPEAGPVRRHGRARRRGRLLRPLPDRNAGHRSRLTTRSGRSRPKREASWFEGFLPRSPG